MKKFAILSGLGVAAVLVGLYAGGEASAQNKATSAAARTRVAIVNIGEVFKNYKKFTKLREDLKQMDQKYVEMLKAKAARLEKLQEEYKAAQTTAQRKEQIESEAKHIKFEMDDIKAKAGKEIGKMQEEQLTMIYREVDSVVREIARAHDYDLVFRYNEDWDKDTYWTSAKVMARLNQPFWPMYYDPSLEITSQVVTLMNQKFASAPPTSGVVPASGTANK